MKIILLSFLLILSTLQAITAQYVKGKVTDQNEQPIYGSTIFIKENQQGIFCNEDGEYQIKLSPGKYTFEFKCIGYKNRSYELIVADKDIIQNVALEENPISLKEVTITNKEDPAYNIIRNAIQRAPEYINNIQSYKAEVYIKANMKLEQISGLMNKLTADKGMKMSDFKDQIFLQESFNLIDFQYPDKYTQTIKAFASTIPENYDSQESFSIMNASIYAPMFNYCISPLNPKAFSYYRFKYLGFIEENNITINMIEFEGKLKDPQLLKGTIYIADNTWHVTFAQMEMNMMGGSQSFDIVYKQIKDKTYLPITYSSSLKMNILGVKGYLNYFSSLKYLDIETNDNQNIKNSEANKKSFFLDNDSLYVRISDSLATKRDSSFWNQIRSVPLDTLEQVSYQKKDSVKQFVDSIRYKYKENRFSVNNLFFGGSIGKDSSLTKIYYKGLSYALHDYNFVDGFTLGQSFSIANKSKNKKSELDISPYLYYTIARKQFIYGSNFDFKYAPFHRGLLQVSTGSISEDFNPQGITSTDNTLSTIFRRSNKKFLYKKNYISVSNNIDITNGFKLTSGFALAKRSGLRNNTEWGIWGNKKNIKPNIYDDQRFDLTSYSIGLSYAPYAYYSIKNNRKVYEKVTSPIFSINYTEGFSMWQTNNSLFKKLAVSIAQDIKTDYFSNLDYIVEGGKFLGNTSRAHFADFQHFNTSNIVLSEKNPTNTFMLLDTYKYSTNKYWIESHINYNSKYILLKRFPIFQGIPIRESLHLKALYTPDLKLYNEVGYSINVLNTIGVGVFGSLNKGRYNGTEFRITYNIQQLARFK